MKNPAFQRAEATLLPHFFRTFQRRFSERKTKQLSAAPTSNSLSKKETLMATNPIGKGTKTIGINMCKKMAEELERRADSMHISKSKYCKIVLQQWIDSGKKLTLGEK
jgi:hypothetical protein